MTACRPAQSAGPRHGAISAQHGSWSHQQLSNGQGTGSCKNQAAPLPSKTFVSHRHGSGPLPDKVMGGRPDATKGLLVRPTPETPHTGAVQPLTHRPDLVMPTAVPTSTRRQSASMTTARAARLPQPRMPRPVLQSAPKACRGRGPRQVLRGVQDVGDAQVLQHVEGGGWHRSRDPQVGQQLRGRCRGCRVLQAAQALQHVLQPHLCTSSVATCACVWGPQVTHWTQGSGMRGALWSDVHALQLHVSTRPQHLWVVHAAMCCGCCGLGFLWDGGPCCGTVPFCKCLRHRCQPCGGVRAWSTAAAVSCP